jgi:hypothetical protein
MIKNADGCAPGSNCRQAMLHSLDALFHPLSSGFENLSGH